MLHADLHSHSTFSDGLVAPKELVARAIAAHLDLYALTDHDETAGLSEAREAVLASGATLQFVNGVECSTLWRHRTIHIVGLYFDDKNPALAASLEKVRVGRQERAVKIAARFDKLGIHHSLEGAMKFVTNHDLISRAHFARYLAETGVVSSKQKAFDRYLGQGKLAYVTPPWPTIPEAVATLKQAGGIAVLAHPGRYKVTPTARRDLIEDFKNAGGEAIEVISPSHTPDDTRTFIELARFYGLAASEGSDFHSDEESRFGLGHLPELPAGTKPVWELRS